MADLTKKPVKILSKGYEVARVKEFKRKDGTTGQTFNASFTLEGGRILSIDFLPDVRKDKNGKDIIFLNYALIGRSND